MFSLNILVGMTKFVCKLSSQFSCRILTNVLSTDDYSTSKMPSMFSLRRSGAFLSSKYQSITSVYGLSDGLELIPENFAYFIAQKCISQQLENRLIHKSCVTVCRFPSRCASTVILHAPVACTSIRPANGDDFTTS